MLYVSYMNTVNLHFAKRIRFWLRIQFYTVFQIYSQEMSYMFVYVLTHGLSVGVGVLVRTANLEVLWTLKVLF